MLREFAAFSQLGPHLRCSRRQIVEYQNQRLRKLIDHAYRNVPYYRRRFDAADIKPRHIQAVCDLNKIPVTEKSDLRAWPKEDFLARGIDPTKLIIRTSGGSTGEPIQVRRTWAEERLLNAFRFRALQTMGMRLTDRRVYIGLTRGRQAADRQAIAKLIYRTKFFRLELLDVLAPPHEIVREIERINPDVITGYAGAVTLLSQKLIDDGKPLIRPRFVATSAEVLTPPMRAKIFQAFGAPVYNIYGANESNLLAWECIKTGEMHTADDLAIIEILRDAAPAAAGERGEVVATCLHSYAMPIIRFRLSDVVTRGSECCACGAPFSTIAAIQGRMIDYFPLPDGRMIHPYEFLTRILHDRIEFAKQYQLIQERPNLVVLRIVVSQMPTPQRLEKIRSDAVRLLGVGVEFRIEFPTELKFEPSGKFRTGRSLVRSAYDGIDWERIVHAE